MKLGRERWDQKKEQVQKVMFGEISSGKSKLGREKIKFVQHIVNSIIWNWVFIHLLGTWYEKEKKKKTCFLLSIFNIYNRLCILFTKSQRRRARANRYLAIDNGMKKI